MFVFTFKCYSLSTFKYANPTVVSCPSLGLLYCVVATFASWRSCICYRSVTFNVPDTRLIDGQLYFASTGTSGLLEPAQSRGGPDRAGAWVWSVANLTQNL